MVGVLKVDTYQGIENTCANLVEPSISVKRKVTVPLGNDEFIKFIPVMQSQLLVPLSLLGPLLRVV